MSVHLDPFIQGPLLMSLLVRLGKLVTEGINIKHKGRIHASKGHINVMEVNHLFQKHPSLVPVHDFFSSTDSIAILICNLHAKEEISNQEHPLTPQMVSEILEADRIVDFFLIELLVADNVVFCERSQS
jgi:hypothetical protein